MTTYFKSDEIPEDVQNKIDLTAEVRCPWYNPRKRGVCIKLLFRGEPSTKPQQFKCPNCGNLTTFVKA